MLVKGEKPAHNIGKAIREVTTVPVPAGMTRRGTRFDDVESASKKRGRIGTASSKEGAEEDPMHPKKKKNHFECPVCEQEHHFRANCPASPHGGSTYHLLHHDMTLKKMRSRLPITLPSANAAKHAALALDSHDLTDYEKMRLSNMKRNHDILVSLGLAASTQVAVAGESSSESGKSQREIDDALLSAAYPDTPSTVTPDWPSP